MNKNDPKWASYNAKIEELIESKDWYRLGLTYYEMADLVHSEGEDPSHLVALGVKCKIQAKKEDIKRYKELGSLSQVELFPNPGACDSCTRQSNIITTLDKPEPIYAVIRNCTHMSGCRCAILPVID